MASMMPPKNHPSNNTMNMMEVFKEEEDEQMQPPSQDLGYEEAEPSISHRHGDPLHRNDLDSSNSSDLDEERALPKPKSKARRSSLQMFLPQSRVHQHLNNNNNPHGSMYASTNFDPTEGQPAEAQPANQAVKGLARYETYGVYILRVILVVVFLGSPVVVSIGVYRYLRAEQANEFEARFAVAADQVYETLQSSLVDGILRPAEDLAWARWNEAHQEHVQELEGMPPENTMDNTTTTATDDANSTTHSTSQLLPYFPFSSRHNWAAVGQRFVGEHAAISLFHESLIVSPGQRLDWQDYANQHNGWVSEVATASDDNNNTTFSYEICHPQVPIVPRAEIPNNETATNYLVSWQTYPLLPAQTLPVYNSDWLATADENDVHDQLLELSAWQQVVETKQVLLTTFYEQRGSNNNNDDVTFALQMPLLDRNGHDNFYTNATALAMAPLHGVHTHHLQWKELWQAALPQNAPLHKLDGIQLVMTNAKSAQCQSGGQSFTFAVMMNYGNDDNGKPKNADLILLDGSPPQGEFDHLKVTRTMEELLEYNDATSSTVPSYPPLNTNYCPITLHIIPTQDTKDQYTDNKPRIFAIAAVAVYVFTSFLLIVYDLIISRRQSIVMKAAVQSTNIVSSLFPSQVRDRLFDLGGAIAGAGGAVVGGIGRGLGFRMRRASAGAGAPEHSPETGEEGAARNPMEPLAAVRQVSPPVADLYPEATVMFADIAGFTAWCSAREPSQVFTLLETLYGTFDQHANKRKVFKVETIGDSYVAVAGLPEPRKDHAVVMARFARNCLDSMSNVCNHLMVELGPDTADLALRVGLHSGAVTAGVLRGQKARFQLFGDTVNTAARMESNGLRGRIQASEATVKALEAYKKGHWATKREDLIEAKGKGKMQTYWIDPKKSSASSSRETESNSGSVVSASEMPNIETWQQAAKLDSLVAWNVDVLSRLLQRIAATRGFVRRSSLGWSREFKSTQHDRAILFERTEQIAFVPSSFDINDENSPALPYLTDEVKLQIRQFVQDVCGLYKENLPFHNFEKATHIALSLKTLILSAHKIYSSSQIREDFFGSDPLAEFGCLFAVLIHSIDHPGVSNEHLVKQKDEKASLYHQRCMNEQHSFNLGFDLLMSDKYSNLRSMIACSKNEWARFRQVVVNCVLATDTFDQDFEDERRDQWEQCFGGSADMETNTKSQNQRRATIFMEYLVQAAAMGPFMQHYQIFNKWFERQVLEVHQGAQQNPAIKSGNDFDWYDYELSRFDDLVIPLVTKLDASGFLGGTGREQLEYAERNRTEFAEKGKQQVVEAVNRLTSSTATITQPPAEPALQDATILEELAKPSQEETNELAALPPV